MSIRALRIDITLVKIINTTIHILSTVVKLSEKLLWKISPDKETSGLNRAKYYANCDEQNIIKRYFDPNDAFNIEGVLQAIQCDFNLDRTTNPDPNILG